MKLKSNDKLIIVDMINGFAFHGALHSKNVANLIPGIKNIIEECISNKIEIIHYTDYHNEDCEEFKSFPPHCIKDTDEAKIITDLDYKEIEVIKKNSTNSFLAKNPFENSIKNLYIVGCVSDICVHDLAHTAIKYVHEHNLKVTVNVIENLCATFDAPNHDSTMIHEQTMLKLKNDGVNIISI